MRRAGTDLDHRSTDDGQLAQRTAGVLPDQVLEPLVDEKTDVDAVVSGDADRLYPADLDPRDLDQRVGGDALGVTQVSVVSDAVLE